MPDLRRPRLLSTKVDGEFVCKFSASKIDLPSVSTGDMTLEILQEYLDPPMADIRRSDI